MAEYEYAVIARDGKLYVQGPWHNDFRKPVRSRLAWPTGLSEKEYPHLVGQKLTRWGVGETGGTFQAENGMVLHLEHGGKTCACDKYRETEEIPKPRGCTTYRNGMWRRRW